MAKKKVQSAVHEQVVLSNWDTPGKRVQWLLNARFTGNRSEMARAIEFSSAAIGQVASGGKPPGGRMLTAIIRKLGVNAEWLIKGEGEPFGTKPAAQDNTLWMPASDRLFPDRLPQQLRELSDRTIVVPNLRPSSQYWLRLRRGDPILGRTVHGFLQEDLLLLETDPAKFPTEEKLREHLCAVTNAPGETPTVKLGSVEFIAADEENHEPACLRVDTFERQTKGIIEEFMFRCLDDGKVEVERRLCRKRQHGGRVEYGRLRQAEVLEPVPRRIEYTDIVAVWTGLMYRRDQCEHCG